jgi:hypothetical protein
LVELVAVTIGQWSFSLITFVSIDLKLVLRQTSTAVLNLETHTKDISTDCLSPIDTNIRCSIQEPVATYLVPVLPQNRY